MDAMRTGVATTLLVSALAALSGCARAGSDSERQAGDALSVAMPAATLGVELWRQEWTGAKQFGESFVVTMAATEVLKRTTRVERPDGSDDRSFPSSHAAGAFSAATYVHRRYGLQDAWPLYAMATYVGYTRVQADRHTWGDVAGAAGVAALSSWWLVDPAQPAVQVAIARKAMFVAWSIPLQ
jgi:membrane-associated phospholipid phosphatase